MPPRSRGNVTTCPTHTARPPTILCASRRRRPKPSPRRPGQPSAGPANHRPNVAPHRPVNHIQTADFPRGPLTARYRDAAAPHHQWPRTPHSLALSAFHDHSPNTTSATIATTAADSPSPQAPSTRPTNVPTPADVHSSSQRIPHRPTTFRAAGDHPATTSQPAGPSIAKPGASRNARRHAPVRTKPDR